MKTEISIWKKGEGWQDNRLPGSLTNPQLVLFFSTVELIDQDVLAEEVRKIYPKAELIGCSAYGIIANKKCIDDAACFSALEFESQSSHIKTFKMEIPNFEASVKAADELISKLPTENLVHALLIGNMVLQFDPVAFVSRLSSGLPKGVGLTGGVAGREDFQFNETRTYYNGDISKHEVILIGFYGPDLNVYYNCDSGCLPYGPERKVTKSFERTIYELDGRPVLELYKEFLGPYANQLPGIIHRYPMAVRLKEGEDQVICSIVAINEADNSITLVGSFTPNSFMQFTATGTERLLNSSEKSLKTNLEAMPDPDLALFFDCAARRLILNQQTEEEIETIWNIYNPEKTALMGFYTYGEISPYNVQKTCQLNNFTMAITAFKEKKE